MIKQQLKTEILMWNATYHNHHIIFSFIAWTLDLNDSKQDHYYNSNIYYHKTSHEQVTIHHNNEV
jgi:hypothetical protein